MLRTLLVMTLAASFVTVTLAQEQPVGAAAGPTITEYIPASHPQYVIELKILEGKGLVVDDKREGEKPVGFLERGDLPAEISDRKPTPLASPTPATFARPQYRPTTTTTEAERATKTQAIPAPAPSPPLPTPEVSDAEFLRRVYLELLGRLPQEKETSTYVKNEDKQKREKLLELIKQHLLTIEGDVSKLRGVTVLAAPKVVTVAGRPATVQIGTEQLLSYLEPLGNGKFEVKRSPALQLGLTITLEFKPVAGDDRFVDMSRFDIQVSALDGREPVEGIEDLDVGRPIVSKRSLQTTAKIRLGETRQIAIPSGPKTQAVALLRVNRVNPQVKE